MLQDSNIIELSSFLQVTKMLMISPTGKEVPIGQTLKPDEYIGMTRCSLFFIYCSFMPLSSRIHLNIVSHSIHVFSNF